MMLLFDFFLEMYDKAHKSRGWMSVQPQNIKKKSFSPEVNPLFSLLFSLLKELF